MKTKFITLLTLLLGVFLYAHGEVTINGIKYELDTKYTSAYILKVSDFYSEEEGYIYDHEEGQSAEGYATVVGCTSANPSSITIPATITYGGKTYKVSSIKNNAFCYISTTKSNLTSVTIGSNVEYIGHGAFYGTSIQSITIPASVKEMSSDIKFGFGAFQNCVDLKKVTFKTTQLRHIPIDCFSGTAITSITIPEGVTHIDEGAFIGCTKLTQISFPKTLHKIGAGAFKNAESLTSVTIPEGCHIIGESAFQNAYLLSKVSLPSTLISIGLKAFDETKIHTDFKESSNTTYSVNKCLLFGGDRYGNKKFTSIPSGTVLIAAGALQYVATKSLSIPSSVKYIGAQPDISSYLSATNGVYYVGNCVLRVTSAASNSVTIKSGTRVIADQAFADASQVTSIKLPESVKYVGLAAMRGRRSVNIPNSLITVGDKAFEGNNYSINTLPSGITYIGDGALGGNEYNRSTIQSLSLSTKITYWGECSFRWLNINDLTIAKGITTIPKAAFYGVANLKTIALPQSLVTIGRSSFFDKHDWAVSTTECTSCVTDASIIQNIETLVIPNSVKTIGDYAFQNRFILDLTIGSSVTEIGFEAFHMFLDLSRTLWDNYHPKLTFISSTPPLAYCYYNGETSEAFSYYEVYAQGDYENRKYPTEVFVPCDAIEKYAAQCWLSGFNKPTGRKYHLYTEANNDAMGIVTGGGYVSICDNPITINAQPKNGYKFTRWDDDITTNPREVTIECDTTFRAIFESIDDGGDPTSPSYLVRFIDWDETILDEQYVKRGRDAVPPQDPYRSGYQFVGWSQDYTNVRQDLDTYATYVKQSEDVDDVAPENNPSKFLKESTILIFRGDKTFTITGQEVK